MTTVKDLRTRARAASTVLATLTRPIKDHARLAMADGLVTRTPEMLAANAADVADARAAGTDETLIDRLALDEPRVAGMAEGLRQTAGLADPIGEVVRGSTLANGLELRQIR